MDRTREDRYRRLEALYSRLEEALPQAEGNPCGTCRACCTGSGLSSHNVTSLELEHIAHRVGSEKDAEFRRFLRRDGEVAVCPHFDEARWGCGIYPYRPFSCRVFGHYRSRATALPEVCVFRGQERIFAVADYLREVPLAEDLRDLAREAWLFSTSEDEQASLALEKTEPSGSFDEGDALDRALNLQAQGRHQEALEEFERSDLPSTAYVLYSLALVFEALGRHQEACLALDQALLDAPGSHRLLFRLGCNLLSCDRQEEAEEALRQTLDVRAEHALAHGMLGAQLLCRGRLEQGRSHLAAAVRLEPGDQAFRRLLAAAGGE